MYELLSMSKSDAIFIDGLARTPCSSCAAVQTGLPHKSLSVSLTCSPCCQLYFLQLADVAVTHGADPILLCVYVLYFTALYHTIGTGHSSCIFDANGHWCQEADPQLLANIQQPESLTEPSTPAA